MVAPEKASSCRSKGTKGEWIEKVYDYVVACTSQKGKISQMGGGGGRLGIEAAQCSVLLGGKRKGDAKNGTSRCCQRCCWDTVEEGHQVQT